MSIAFYEHLCLRMEFEFDNTINYDECQENYMRREHRIIRSYVNQ